MVDAVITKIILRFVFGGSAVVAAALFGKWMGGRIGGIFAAFPAVFLSAAIAVGVGVSASEAHSSVFAVSQGALIGMAANIVCAIIATVAIPRKGWAKGLLLAIVVWIILASAIYYTTYSLGITG